MPSSGTRAAKAPGRDVRARSGLSKAVLGQGWGMPASMQDGRPAAGGGRLIRIPARSAGRTCPERGFRHSDSRETQARPGCLQRGLAENADVAGAMNGFTAGRADERLRGTWRPRPACEKRGHAGDQGLAFASVSAGIPWLQSGEDVKAALFPPSMPCPSSRGAALPRPGHAGQGHGPSRGPSAHAARKACGKRSRPGPPVSMTPAAAMGCSAPRCGLRRPAGALTPARPSLRHGSAARPAARHPSPAAGGRGKGRRGGPHSGPFRGAAGAGHAGSASAASGGRVFRDGPPRRPHLSLTSSNSTSTTGSPASSGPEERS
jgi:hypothetical protein